MPCILVCSLLLLTACSSPTKSAAPQQPAKAQKEEYAQAQSIGSWIPRKTKKKEDVVAIGVSAVEGQALENVVNAGLSRGSKEPR